VHLGLKEFPVEVRGAEEMVVSEEIVSARFSEESKDEGQSIQQAPRLVSIR